MSAATRARQRDKELLLARSALCRLRLRHQARQVRESLGWKRMVFAAATAPATRRIAFGIALSAFGLARSARMVLLAGRVLVFGRLAAALIGRRR